MGVPCLTFENAKDCITVLDVRDYNQSYKDSIQSSINIPIAYLKRNVAEIQGKKIHIVATNHIEKNMSVRFLRKKGYKVISYSLTDCPCLNK